MRWGLVFFGVMGGVEFYNAYRTRLCDDVLVVLQCEVSRRMIYLDDDMFIMMVFDMRALQNVMRDVFLL